MLTTVWLAPNARAADPYPNRLREPLPHRPQVRWAPWMMVGLVALALIPRAIMASKLDVICNDGVLYLRVAQSMESGDFAAPGSLGLHANLYPLVLMLLHQAGLDWDTGPRIWGVLVSTLAVLPLFGWVRRQFDDRVGVVAGVLYAVHPDLIEWSPEVMREPTFWLLFLVGLYALWRAVTEVRPLWFAVAGAAIALSSLTRFEGMFLWLPVVCWAVVRWRSLHQSRARLAIGTALCGASFPAVLIALNLACVGAGSTWSLVRVDPFLRVVAWAGSWTGVESADDVVTDPAPRPTPAPPRPLLAAPAVAAVSVESNTEPLDVATPERMALGKMTWTYIDAMQRGLSPLFALLLFGGYFAWRRTFDRSDHLPLAIVALLIAAGAWIHLWHTQLISSRYALSIVLLSTRPAALGIMSLGGRLAGMARRRKLRPSWTYAMPAAALALVAFAGLGDALSSSYGSRASLASLGEWIRARYGDSSNVVGSEKQLPLLGYYAHSNVASIPRGLAGRELVDYVAQRRPDVVLISQRYQLPCDYELLLSQRDRLGLELVDARQLPQGTRRVLVLGRVPDRQQVLQKAELPSHPEG